MIYENYKDVNIMQLLIKLQLDFMIYKSLLYLKTMLFSVGQGLTAFGNLVIPGEEGTKRERKH